LPQNIARRSGTSTTLDPETGFCRARVLQARGLKGVSQKHEAAEPQAREEILAFESAEEARAKREHQHSRDCETHREKDKHGGMIQRVLDDHKRRTPQQGTQGQGQIGTRASGHFESS
jgi:hypothetical protein